MSELFNLEGIAEVAETAELTKTNELLAQRDALQEKLDAALEENNVEKANFFKGELGKITERFDNQRIDRNGELSFGSGHSAEYYYNKAGEELARNGETRYYKECIKRAGKAEAERLKKHK